MDPGEHLNLGISAERRFGPDQGNAFVPRRALGSALTFLEVGH
jgi:hypothetical protein